MATSFYRSSSKANDRVGRIRKEMNRSSAYILSSDLPGSSIGTSSYSSYSSSTSSSRASRPRDSSLGASFRVPSSSRRESSYVPSSPMMPRRRETSITMSSPTLSRRTTATTISSAGLGTETAKFNREESIREIKDSFDRQFKQTQNKLRPGGDEENSMSKARAKILGNVPNAWDDVTTKRNCLSDMYTEMKNFSTKTVAAINSVADCDFSNKKKEDYNWRKELQDYEKSQAFERDVRIRNIDTSRKRKDANESDVTYLSNRRSSSNTRGGSVTSSAVITSSNNNRSSSTSGRPPLAPSPTSTPAAKKERKAEPQMQQPMTQKRVTINTETPSSSSTSTTTPGSRKSWRDRFNEKQEKQKAAIIAEFSAEAEERAKSLVSSHLETKTAAPAPMEEEKPAPTPKKTVKKTPSVEEGESKEATKEKKEGAAEGEEEEDQDVHGTKKMKSDFDSMMNNLDQEMEAGRSKLSKLRERMRRVKASIKAADEAQAEEDRKRAS